MSEVPLYATPTSMFRQLHLTNCILTKREFFTDNLLVRIHFIIVIIRWTGLAPWEFES